MIHMYPRFCQFDFVTDRSCRSCGHVDPFAIIIPYRLRFSIKGWGIDFILSKVPIVSIKSE